MLHSIPRPEHPQPQFERAAWENLNGQWQFAFDFGKSGFDRHFEERESLENTITVPFCPESELSGIGCKDFIPAVWYLRTFSVTKEQLAGRVLLHFGAVDYEAHVYINGKEAGTHRGGYTSFCFDITALCAEGENRLTVCAVDDNRTGKQPHGKQSELFYSHDCDYTRTTGIWQTVWLEFVPKSYVKSVKYFPNIAAGTLTVQAELCGAGVFSVQAFFEGRPCGEDTVKSYAGLREVSIDGMRVLLNGRPVFQRLVLDQGFYPDGIYTAPDEAALVRDIELSLAAGFNGARLHEKVFEPRFLYHCDRLGYLAWGEMANWGLDLADPAALEAFQGEWIDAVTRDFNHPAIVGWCPFNETWDRNGRAQLGSTLAMIYRVTKVLDPTRPCIDTSGNYHVVTDIYDVHNYEQDPEKFAAHYEAFRTGGAFYDEQANKGRQHYTEGLPMFVSEYGGIKWNPDGDVAKAWGYGQGPKTEEEFISRYRGLTDVLLDNPNMFGFCYTQLYDVEQETNGLYTYDRTPKFDMAIFAAINRRKAACEE